MPKNCSHQHTIPTGNLTSSYEIFLWLDNRSSNPEPLGSSPAKVIGATGRASDNDCSCASKKEHSFQRYSMTPDSKKINNIMVFYQGTNRFKPVIFYKLKLCEVVISYL